MAVPLISTRGLDGLELYIRKPTGLFKVEDKFLHEKSKTCKTSTWSKTGRLFAWTNGAIVKVVDTTNWSLNNIEIPHQVKTSGLQFSPKENYLVVYQPYAVTKDIPVNTPNLHIWNLNTKQVVKSFVQKSQSKWQPSWTSDEKLMARNINQELQVFEVDNLNGTCLKMEAKVCDYSVSPGPAPYHFLCYMQGSNKGQPSFAKLFRYPNFQATGLITQKSFFQGDYVEMKWNNSGTAVLLLTSTDYDATGASYYGKQSLHFLDTKGNSAMVQLAKDGPIYAYEWNPNGKQFVVVYGFMPAKSTLFDLKCEATFHFGTGPRNAAYFNNFGNILLLGGFGNLRGKLEVWDVKGTKMISQFDVPDSTHLQWCPDGETFMTSTCAPRLREGNGWKIWHYSGSLLHEQSVKPPLELWETSWQPLPVESFAEFTVSNKKVAGIKSSQPQVSKELYRPPGARGTSAILKFLEEREAPSKPNQSAILNAQQMENAAKNKKKREQRKSKKVDNQSSNSVSTPLEPKKVEKTDVPSTIQLHLTGNQDTDKQLKDLKKKLDQIAKLKAEQAAGKKLEVNQIEKLQKEDEFVKLLEKLNIPK